MTRGGATRCGSTRAGAAGTRVQARRPQFRGNAPTTTEQIAPQAERAPAERALSLARALHSAVDGDADDTLVHVYAGELRQVGDLLAVLAVRARGGDGA